MNIDLIVVGKTDSPLVAGLIEEYGRRISRYVRFACTALPDPKNRKSLSEESQKRLEGEMLLKQFSADDWVVLLDDKGTERTSVEFARWLEGVMLRGRKRLCFVVGGPYGFSRPVYERANESLSLSRMTFSHQIVRALFAEQLYRAFTILHGEPYHHE